MEMQLITPEICTFLARLSGGEFSEIALFLIPLPWLHSSFLLPSARPSFIFQLECLITAEPLQVWNNARKIPREKLSQKANAMHGRNEEGNVGGGGYLECTMNV